MSTVIKVENISKQYRLGDVGTGTISHDLNRWWARLRGKEDPTLQLGEVNDRSKAGDSDYVWALKDINFEVKAGEVLGIIGRNGAGKSTLLKILSKTTQPTTGTVKLKGRVASLLEVGTGFHPELSGRDNIFLNGAILGMTKREIQSKFDEIVDFSGVERYIDTPVKRYSSGMYVRLAFAVAAHLEPEILIVDEVLAVGDAEFQKKCLGKMKDVSVNDGRTVLFVSHNMQAVKQLCKECIVLKNGTLFDSGEASTIIDNYLSVDNIITVTKKWHDKYPGNEFIRISEIYACYDDGKVSANGNFSITKSLNICIKYTVTKEGFSFIHGANFYNGEDVNIFNSHDVTSDGRYLNRELGDYESIMQIPDNLLSEGTLSISIAFFKPNPFDLFVYLDKAITINIIDEMDGSSSRGNYTLGFPGFIRPKLFWKNIKL